MKMRKNLLFAYSLAIIGFLYLPIAVLILYSFNDSRINATWSGFTLKWYTSLFENDRVLDALTNSLIIAVVTTVVTTILAAFLSLALHRYKFRFKQAFNGLIYLPILIPDILMGLSLLVMFSQLYMPLGKLTIIIAHITFSLSFAVVIITARLAGMGQELEEAAQDLGASSFNTFRYITLPIISPGLIAAALMTFTMSLDDFVISFFVAGPDSTTLPLYIYGMVKRGVSPELNALSTIMILVIVVLIVLAESLAFKGTGNKTTQD
ncbi:ABC transporter permease [Brevibacillus sp. 7WMA2]|uniref:Inner membrane ABC transporter permease protein YdcV n=2 Tax=Brevibacillus TaxID=55080 RepID=A0A075RC32_BRELA|nr:MULTISPECIES: ABC transporter permease [Brevibacillus]AIG28763.1 inner membrane ABC transporter permease protein YdcV [Brevibacillus laterosporus LMG 15441]AUM67087.1 ABC transporter permease [Brevibacillus laterosporus]AYK05945.1 ABC transporter permease [Brevibacillus laterosporus]ERM16989.1 putrescine/spermidine ABC transporter permease [Brevibacillus laterosporus PE36]MBA4531750.1 ABC transporter permease [Brevibacillus halotolerans]